MGTKIGDWIHERSGWREQYRALFLRKIPKINWLYTLGSATLVTMVIQIVTGILLTLYYVPDPQEAYASVSYITNDLPFGWLIRGLHHWGASAMVLLVILHMVRVIMYGAYKYPREFTWFTGVALLLLTFSFGSPDTCCPGTSAPTGRPWWVPGSARSPRSSATPFVRSCWAVTRSPGSP